MIRLSAPAKLNLYLHILGRRADGYHLLDSLFAFVEGIGDRLRITPADTDSLSLTGPFAGALAGDNLVLKALSGLRRLAPALPGQAIRLEKNLPVAAGLGGGSADAAAVLRYFGPRLGIASEALQALALTLGADVPACVEGRPLFVSGIGEGLEAAPALPAVPLVLANPRVPLSTAAVFRTLAPPYPHDAPVARPAAFADAAALIDWLQALANDLEPTARALCPAIAPLADALAAQPGCRLVRMAGSGPSLFGLFEDPAKAAAAAAALESTGAWAMAGRLAQS